MFPRPLSPRSMAKEVDPFRAHVLTSQGVDGQKRSWSRVRRKRAPRPPFQRPAAPRAVEGSLSRLRDCLANGGPQQVLSGARLVEVEGSLSRRRDFEITAWVVAALPAAAASWRYVRNLWIDEPQFGKMDLHLWHQGDTFQQVQW